MAKLNNLRVEYRNEVTINLGNFENQKPGYAVSADVPEGMHPDEARSRIKTLVDGWLEADIDEIREEMRGAK